MSRRRNASRASRKGSGRKDHQRREPRKRKTEYNVSAAQTSNWRKSAVQESLAGKAEVSTSNSYKYTYCSKRHWQEPVELLDGVWVRASAYFDRPKSWVAREEDIRPDVGFYLDDYWADNSVLTTPGMRMPFMPEETGAIQKVIYPWIDGKAPVNRRELQHILKWLLEKAGEGNMVDIGCLGGHGRTGTMIACLMVVQGLTASQAIQRVRRNYCQKAVETNDQVLFVMQVEASINGQDQPTFSTIRSMGLRGSNTRHRDISAGDVAFTSEDKEDIIYESWAKEYEDYTSAAEYAAMQKYGYANAWPGTIEGVTVPKAGQPGREPSPVQFGEFEDSDDYELWQERNQYYMEQHLDDIGAEMRAQEQEAQQRHCDSLCLHGPCMLPNQCDPAEGDCFLARVSEEVIG